VRDGLTRPRPTGDLRSNAAPSTPCLDRGTACIRCETGRERRPRHTRGCPSHARSWHAPHGLPRPVAARTVPSGEHSCSMHCIQGPPRPVFATDQRRRTCAVTVSAPPLLLPHDSFLHPFLACFSFPFLHPRSLLRPPLPPFPPLFFFGRTREEGGPLPRRRVRARPRPTAPTGDRVSVKPRAVSPLLGPPAGILEWPPRRVGGLHSVFSLVTPPVGACGTVTNRPLGRVGLGGAASYVPFLGPTAGCARRRHAGRAGLTVRFSLATPPVGACGTGADCPRGRSRCCGTADCVPPFGANRWDLRVAATPGGRSSLRISVCLCPRDS